MTDSWSSHRLLTFILPFVIYLLVLYTQFLFYERAWTYSLYQGPSHMVQAPRCRSWGKLNPNPLITNNVFILYLFLNRQYACCLRLLFFSHPSRGPHRPDRTPTGGCGGPGAEDTTGPDHRGQEEDLSLDRGSLSEGQSPQAYR